LIFAAPFASKIRILQSIGRCLRKCVGKNGAIIYDLVDFNNKYCPKYADTRLRFYDQEKFPVTEKDFKEK
jgi:superfamily II DNA or RNA helicase